MSTYLTRTEGICVTAFHFSNTVIPLVLQKAEFYIFLFFHLSVFFLTITGRFVPAEYHLELTLQLTSITGPLMTFFVVFYNGNVFRRYQRLHELCKAQTEIALYLVHTMDKDLKDKLLCRRLARWLLSSCIMFVYERAEDAEHVYKFADDDWETFEARGFLSGEEVEFLREHCRVNKDAAMPSFLLIHWSMKLYRMHSLRVPDLDKYYLQLRKVQEDVGHIMNLPMPFQYFHVMNLMLLLNLGLWAFSLALEDSFFAPIIFVSAQLMFQGIRELSVAMSDPFGHDSIDFPIGDWMTTLYLRIYWLVEHDLELVHIGREAPLVELGPDEDLLTVISSADTLDLNHRGPSDRVSRRISLAHMAKELELQEIRIKEASGKQPVLQRTDFPGCDSSDDDPEEDE